MAPTPKQLLVEKTDGHLARNVVQFCRLLRAAGLPVGPAQALTALQAVRTAGIGPRADLYWALHAALVNRRDQSALFDQAFHLFWRDPDRLRRSMALMLAGLDGLRTPSAKPLPRRLAEALRRPDDAPESTDDPDTPPDLEFDAALTMSDRETLQTRDFEEMSAAEMAEAKRAVAALRLPAPDLPTRRFRADSAGPRLDLRGTFRRSLRVGAAGIDLARQRRRVRPPPLVVLCDISGSMSRYARMLLHFVHAATTDRDRVHAFVFGTRLTNISRQLRHRDPDEAMAQVGLAVEDWSGGTRIGQCLTEFNRWWGRRVLGQGAVVLLITDGLERDDSAPLATAMARLHRAARRLIWLNPLLRYDGYAPKSLGARVMIRHVDEFRPVHNIASLNDLVDALGAEARPRDLKAGATHRVSRTAAAGRRGEQGTNADR